VQRRVGGDELHGARRIHGLPVVRAEAQLAAIQRKDDHGRGIGGNARGGEPSWGAKPFPKGDRSGKFVTLASGIDGDSDALPIRSDARVLGANLKAGETAEYTLGGRRHAYLVPAKGKVEVNGVGLNARDGAAITEVETIRVTAVEDAEVVLVDAA
jgi:redox-sensitive bicupin YhaK (pirin superfamily)